MATDARLTVLYIRKTQSGMKGSSRIFESNTIYVMLHEQSLVKLISIEKKINNKVRFRDRDINVIAHKAKEPIRYQPKTPWSQKNWKRNKTAHDPLQNAHILTMIDRIS